MPKKDEQPQPSTTDSTVRGPKGRFGPGNKFAKGNPHAQRVAELRSILLGAVKDGDFQEIAQTLIKLSKGGDLAAMKELFQRTLGPAVEIDLIERLEQLEAKIVEISQAKGAA